MTMVVIVNGDNGDGECCWRGNFPLSAGNFEKLKTISKQEEELKKLRELTKKQDADLKQKQRSIQMLERQVQQMKVRFACQTSLITKHNHHASSIIAISVSPSITNRHHQNKLSP